MHFFYYSRKPRSQVWILGPIHTYPYSFENETCFLRLQKNSRPLVAFSPSTRMRWIDLKTMNYPTAHANITRSGLELIMWPQRFRKVPFSHVHTYTRKHYKTAFSKSFTMESVFEKFRFDWSFSSDTCGRKPYPKRKSCVFKSKRISVDRALELVFLNRETDTKK